MAHNHSHNHNRNDPQGNVSKNIVITLILNAVFVVIELIGGLMTNSIAILSDALHDFGDCISLLIAWRFQKKSEKKRDKFYSYGYKRFSLLGSIFLSGVLTISSIFIIIEASKRLFDTQEVDAQGMFWLAIFGVVINGIAALRLKKGNSLNEKAIYIHIMEDVLGWVAVLIVSIILNFYDLPILDPILSIVISLWVLTNVYKNLRDVFKVLFMAIPDTINVDEFSHKVENIPNVNSIHDLHIWSLDGDTHVASLHVVMAAESDANRVDVKENIRTISKEYNINHITIDVEMKGDRCHEAIDE